MKVEYIQQKIKEDLDPKFKFYTQRLATKSFSL